MASEEQVEEFYRVLGERVKAGRTGAKMSQADLAARLGLTRASIANLEAGRQRPAAHQAAMLAQVLDVPIGELLATAPEPSDPIRAQHAQLRLRAQAWIEETS